MNKKQLRKKAELSWEGCDSCTEQDEIMYKNGYVKGYNVAISESSKEISDEEIEKKSNEFFPMNDSDREMKNKAMWKLGAKWVINLLNN
jgi:hypothetical protein